jgi:hypothetical protein
VTSTFPADDIIAALALNTIGCEHDTIVHPTGSPISVSTHLGFSLPDICNPWRLPCVLRFAGTAWPRISATIAPINLSLRLRCVPSGFTASSEQPVVSFQSLAFAVGHDEHPLSLVRCANFSRAEYAPRRAVTESFQFCNDFSQSKRDVSLDVLEEADSWSQNPNASCNGWPEVALVVCPESLTGG